MKLNKVWAKVTSVMKGAGQEAIDALRAKQGQPDTIDPVFHANTLQAVYDDLRLTAASAGAVDIVKKYGAKLDGSDETGILLQAMTENAAVYIPNAEESGTLGILRFSDTIVMQNKGLFVNGMLEWAGKDKPAIWMKQSSWLEGGVTSDVVGQGVRHFLDVVGSRHHPRDCALLLNKGNTGVGCIENKVKNFVIDGYGIKTAGTYSSDAMKEIESKPEQDCQYAAGKGIWLLAGCDYGFTREAESYNYMEFVYRNSFENVRVNGYGDPVCLEAGWLWLPEDPADPDSKLVPCEKIVGKTYPNGWVNGNRFDGLWIRYGRRYIHLISPLGAYYPKPDGSLSDSRTLCGECSGNFFNSVDIQTSAGTYEQGLLVEAGNFNHFEIMHWDAKTTAYPLVIFRRGEQNQLDRKTLGASSYNGHGNTLKLTGSDITMSNNGIVDEYAGYNRFECADAEDSASVFPVPSAGSADHRSYIGVVQNYWGLAQNIQGNAPTIWKLDADGNRIGQETYKATRSEVLKAFNPDPLDILKLQTTSSVRGYEVEIIHNEPISVDMLGVTFGYTERINKSVEFELFDEADTSIATLTATCEFNSQAYVRKYSTGVKKVVVRFLDPDMRTANISIGNLWAVSYRNRSDCYHFRNDDDNRVTGRSLAYEFQLDTKSGVEGFYDAAGTWHDGEPTGEQMRALGYEVAYRRPVMFENEIIITDSVTGKLFNLEIKNGTITATPL